MAGYIGTQAVSVNTTSATISDDLAVGDDATIAGTLGVTGVVTANAGVVVDEMTLDADTLTATDTFTIDAVDDITLNSDNSGRILFGDASVIYGIASNSSSNFVLEVGTNDKDMLFRGQDGGSVITALTLDMSAAGAATFGSTIAATSAAFTPSSGETVVINRDGAGPYFGNSTNHSLRLITNNATRLIISNSGNISTNPPAGNHFVINENGVDSDFRVLSDADTHALFVNGGTGTVNVGSAYGGNSKFTVSQSASEIACYFTNTLSTVLNSTPPIIYLQTPNDAVIQDGYKMVSFADQDTVLGSISTAATSSNVAYNTSSDERLKENIVDAGSQLDTLLAVKVREYDWKKNGFHSTGFIAQELHEHIPEAVTVGLEDPTQHPWSVDYGRLTPFIIKAMQEQQTLIETLTARAAALEE